ncbi:IEC3 subunit of the Ino80 complex, chromatin re-modelling-domain-containing protein [Podospora conica]|nr:IEC3 subunit of the Ino80 complex, chromatin re-modelling-domain-containing protein [Schizothecium conicum]
MDYDSRARSERDFKTEDESGDIRMGMADDKPTYRSWKKKYRKMRIKFDQKMHEGEELHKLEQKALATARRLAIQKDRLVDLLLDVNNCPQIPPERRFDLRLPAPADPEAPALDIDRSAPSTTTVPPSKSLATLLASTPHATIAAASESYPSLLADLAAGRDSPADPNQGLPHPPSFLTADDIDNYLYELDVSLGVPNLLPTLAPVAHETAAAPQPPVKDGSLSHSRDFQLRNPTSVYNWLRKHAPKTFLQDAEAHGHGGGGADEDHAPAPTSTRGGRGKGERGPRGGGSTRGKRGGKAAAAAAAARAELHHHEDGDETMALYGEGTPTAKGGKRKRGSAADDDPGYRPKGGSSRPPAKKKRRSDGAEGAATGGKRPRKSGLGTEVYSAGGKGDD